MKKKIKEIIICVMLGALGAALLLTIFFHAVIQTSFRMSPPTEAEIAEDPSLARYLND